MILQKVALVALAILTVSGQTSCSKVIDESKHNSGYSVPRTFDESRAVGEDSPSWKHSVGSKGKYLDCDWKEY